MSTLELFNLTGRVALVTGCNRGIGYGMALALAEAGADIIGVSKSLASEGSEIEKAVREKGRKFSAYQCDLSDLASVEAFADRVLKASGAPDILVNNAGSIRRQPAAEHSREYWLEVIDVNLNSQWLLSQKIGASMVKRGSGKIIFTASLLTFQGGINVPSYAASKGAIGQLTKALANEWAAKGVNVNAIAPGYVATDNTEALRADPLRSEQILNRIPAGRWGVIEDFQGPAVFLASNASNYVNGEILVVDGGWMGR